MQRLGLWNQPLEIIFGCLQTCSIASLNRVPHFPPWIHIMGYWKLAAAAAHSSISTGQMANVLIVVVQSVSSSVAQLCLTLCDTMDHSMWGLPFHHQLQKSIQTHLHCVGDAIQPSHPVIPFSSYLQSFPASESFQKSQLFSSSGQGILVSASISVLPMNTQDWFPLGWTSWISLQSKRLESLLQHHSSNASILQLSVFIIVQLSHQYDYWKNHSLDEMGICWQSNVSAFYLFIYFSIYFY